MSFREFEDLRKKHLAAVNLAKNVEDCRSANLIDLKPETPIYRIFSIERLLSTLKEQKLCLVKPELWDDPFENFLLKSKGSYNGISVSFEEIRKQVYGQCWSLKEECDGLWRNYTSKSCKGCDFDDFKKRHGHTPVSAKVKTTVGKLMNAFYDITNEWHSLCYFMGKVIYLPKPEFIDYLRPDNVTDKTNFRQTFSLLIKRDAFSYEEEVRLVFWKPGEDYGSLEKVKNKWDNSNLFKFSVDPNTLFDEIVFDPWIDDENYNHYENEIKNYYSGIVCKSKLYDESDFTVNLNR